MSRLAPRARALAALALLVALALVLAGPALAADPLKDFKRDWEAASRIEKESARGDAQAKALETLRGEGSVETAKLLVALVQDAKLHWKPHDAAVKVLGTLTGEPVRTWVAKQAKDDKSPEVRSVLCQVVSGYGDDVALRTLVPILKDKDANVVAAAADGLSRVRKKEAVEALVAALKTAREGRTRDDLSCALATLTKKPLHDAAEWISWWQDNGDKWTFEAAGAEAAPEPTAAGGVPKTTSDGSGLYERVTSNHVAFLIDISFSMRITGDVIEEEKPDGKPNPGTTSADPAKSGGANQKKTTLSRLAYVQRELVNVIEHQLSPKASFNVIAFDDKLEPWKPKLTPASDANRKAAKDWVSALRPRGETNIYDALEAAFADRSVDTIYLLTDGFPTNGKFVDPDSICGEVRKWNATRRVRIHCICYVVGDPNKFHVIENKSMSRTFMKQLAEATGGTLRVFDDTPVAADPPK